MGIVSIDFDDVKERLKEAEDCLIEFKPCLVRISASGDGLHLVKWSNNGKDLEIQKKYDDKRRFRLDEQRKKLGLTSQILFDKKYFFLMPKYASKWCEIISEEDVKKFIEVIKNHE